MAFPVIIFCKDYHKEMIEHIEKMRAMKTISEEDLELFLVTDSIEEATALIKKCIRTYGLTHFPKKPSWILGEKR